MPNKTINLITVRLENKPINTVNSYLRELCVCACTRACPCTGTCVCITHYVHVCTYMHLYGISMHVYNKFIKIINIYDF